MLLAQPRRSNECKIIYMVNICACLQCIVAGLLACARTDIIYAEAEEEKNNVK